MSMRITRHTILAWSAAITLVGLFILAVWPAPNKYPWGVPIAAVVTCALCALRSSAGDDFSAFSLGFAGLGALATWTLSSWQNLDDQRSIILWLALIAVPELWLITLVRSNSTGLTPSPIPRAPRAPFGGTSL